MMKKIMKNRLVIKLGGSSLLNENIVEKLSEMVRQYRKYDYDVIIVHGGGPAINAELTRRGITWSFIDGQRVTTPEMIETIEMVLKGSINGKVVRALDRMQIPAMGLSGSEGHLLFCEQANEELQRVGRVLEVNTCVLESVLNMPGSPVPVVAPLGVGAAGDTFNINADWAAAKIAMAVSATELIYLTDQRGILNENKILLHDLDEAKLQALIDGGVVSGGMLAKAQTIMAAMLAGINKVRVLHAEDAMTGLWSDSVGTNCLREEHFNHLQLVGEAYASF